LSKLGIETQFVNGLRYTTEEVLDVVEMVLSGTINKQLVRRIQSAGGQAIGLSGTDASLLLAKLVAQSAEVGLVGEVTKVNEKLLRGMLELGCMPVIAPLGITKDGQRLNINADSAAGAIASRLGVKQMIVVTDVPGIIRNINGEKRVLPVVTVQQTEDMIRSGEIYGGMIPKVRAAIDCINGEVQEVVIVPGSGKEVISSVLAGEPVGTRIVRM
jgi:acetylglutamate kinase